MSNVTQKFGFFLSQANVIRAPVLPPTRSIISVNMKKDLVPITTIFIGDITELCPNELLQEILNLCGSVNSWKRVQDTNSKYKAFGFCEFIHPEGTLRSLRILNKFQLGDKKLTVKTDDNTAKMLEDFTEKAKEVQSDEGNIKNNGDGSDLSDKEILTKINELIKEKCPELIAASEAAKENENKRRPRSSSVASNNSEERDSVKKARKRKRSRTTSADKHRHRSTRSRSRKSSIGDRSPRRSSKRGHSSSTSLSSNSSSEDDSTDSRSRGRRHHRYSGGGHSASRRRADSEDSDDIKERRRVKQLILRKEQAYQKRLEKWEDRERRMAKQYEKDEESELQRKKMIQREARKLRQFLEDYEDERDDPKYYKSSSLFQRRRNYDREREADAKDRQEELLEIEELKKQILAENKNVEDAEAEAKRLHEKKDNEKLKHVRTHSGSPTPHRPLGQPLIESNGVGDVSNDDAAASPSASSSAENDGELKTKQDAAVKRDDDDIKGAMKMTVTTTVKSESFEYTCTTSTRMMTQENHVLESDALSQPKRKLIATLEKPSISMPNGGVFGNDDDDEEDGIHVARKKIKLFEITREDRMQAMTPEERKKLTKDLIERIPTAKSELFNFEIVWEFVDEALIEKRVKPWINKKICDYIGDEEPSLVAFICEKIVDRATPQKILGDLAMVLDDEAEVFMIKLWRLIIFESEAKRLGLSQASTSADGGSGMKTDRSTPGGSSSRT